MRTACLLFSFGSSPLPVYFRMCALLCWCPVDQWSFNIRVGPLAVCCPTPPPGFMQDLSLLLPHTSSLVGMLGAAYSPPRDAVVGEEAWSVEAVNEANLEMVPGPVGEWGGVKTIGRTVPPVLLLLEQLCAIRITFPDPHLFPAAALLYSHPNMCSASSLPQTFHFYFSGSKGPHALCWGAQRIGCCI